MFRVIQTSNDRTMLMPEYQNAGTAAFLAKRVFDVVVAATLLLLLGPLLCLIALAIVLDSPGHPLFIQKRVGARRSVLGGRTVWEVRTFPVFKFRTMRHGVSQSLHEQHVQAFIQGKLDTYREQNGTFKLTSDPRVTRFGAFLRKSSLDELPQLLNVLRGEMSLVGPRPVPTYETEAYEEWHRERLAALPGITGLWQVQARSQVSFEEMVRLDIEYVRTRSMRMDLFILFRTARIVLSGFGAG
jgi:lipopolysaccharide/colanic/teichoic acid biosynthesis glycosyltransferase